MNCLALEEDGAVLVIDCGVAFDGEEYGVDVVHPDFAALEPYRDRIAGVVITHGHEDHVGAVPYFLKRFDVPVWAPPYALGLHRERAEEHEELKHARLYESRPRLIFRAGPFGVDPIRVTHSIADATALAIHTSAGLVVHSGDFKIDAEPTDGEPFDAERLSALGDEGVKLLFSDSTNVTAEGWSGSEASVEGRCAGSSKLRRGRSSSACSRRTCIACGSSGGSRWPRVASSSSSGGASGCTRASRGRRATSSGRATWYGRSSGRGTCRKTPCWASRPGRKGSRPRRSRGSGAVSIRRWSSARGTP